MKQTDLRSIVLNSGNTSHLDGKLEDDTIGDLSEVGTITEDLIKLA